MHIHTEASIAGAIINGRTGEVATVDDETRDELHSMCEALVMQSVPAIFGKPTVAEAREINMNMLNLSILTYAQALSDGTPLTTEHMRIPQHVADMLKKMPEAVKPDHFDQLIDSVTERAGEVGTDDLEAMIKAVFTEAEAAKDGE